MIAQSKNPRMTRVFVALLMLLLGVALAACNYGGGDEPGTCDPEELVSPDPTYPVNDSVISELSPTYRWTYPDPDCLPEEFKVLVSSSSSWFDSGPILARAIVSGTTTSWHPDLTLAPGDIYYFHTYAISGERTGPGRGHHFWTGPLCSETGDALQAPVLESPADGARLEEMAAHLRWDDPTPCVHDSHYWVEVATNRRFAGAYERWTSIFQDDDLPNEEITLEPCTTYYWRVRTGTPPDGLDGLYSETWSFTTPPEAGGICPLEVVITPMIPAPGVGFPFTGHAAIAGHVFHDECATPWETTTVTPPGCVIMPDASIEANGELDPGESGIEGVTVLLDDGPCPGVDGWSVATDASGQFGFYDLTAGTYCLEVNGSADGNELILVPGHWTMPYRWYGPGPISVEVTLGSDDDISRMNHFGWDYQFLPPPSGEPEAGTPFARARIASRCRLGPGFEYPTLAFLSPGDTAPIIGRLELGGWWQLRFASLDTPCWIGEDVVEPEGDLRNIPFALAPLLPTEETVIHDCWCWDNPNHTACQYRAICPANCDRCTSHE